jgi:DNA-binding MarR family transcriptional regulator
MDEALFQRFRRAYWSSLRELESLRLRQWERSQVTLPQLRVVAHVRHSPGITIGKLASLLGVTVSTTSGLVTKLVDRGLLVRTSAEGDRRRLPLQLTAAGEELAGEVVEQSGPFLERTATLLGDDLLSVVAALERLAAASGQATAESRRSGDGEGA